jgi:hypothetical protein
MNLNSLMTLAGSDGLDKSSTLASHLMNRMVDLVGPDGAEMVWYGVIRFESFC